MISETIKEISVDLIVTGHFNPRETFGFNIDSTITQALINFRVKENLKNELFSPFPFAPTQLYGFFL